MPEDDAELVALIDNELDEGRRTALWARLAADEQLRQRYDELRAAGPPIAASFDSPLAQAPLARLRALLPLDRAVRQPPRDEETIEGATGDEYTTGDDDEDCALRCWARVKNATGAARAVSNEVTIVAAALPEQRGAQKRGARKRPLR